MISNSSRNSITPLQRRALRQYAQGHPKLRQHDLRTWFEQTFGIQLSKSSISHSLSDKYNCLDSQQGIPVNRKRLRKSKWPELEEALYQWYIQVSKSASIPGDVIKTRALELWSTTNPGAEPPSLSNGWLSGFKDRYGLTKKRDRQAGQDSTMTSVDDSSAMGAEEAVMNSPMSIQRRDIETAPSSPSPPAAQISEAISQPHTPCVTLAPSISNSTPVSLPKLPQTQIQTQVQPQRQPQAQPQAHPHPMTQIMSSFESSPSASVSVANDMQMVRSLVRQYHPADVYNCDETSLFWEHMPDSMLDSSQRSETRFTAHFCCNGDGSDKLKPWLIGNSGQAGFSGPEKSHLLALNCVWKTNDDAWMSKNVMRDWLLAFDRHVAPKGRKVLLLMDRFPIHEAIMSSCPPLLHTVICFLPENMATKTQPLIQGIIANFKGHYRRRWLQFMLDEFEEKRHPLNRMSLLRAIRWSTQAWSDVSEATIVNCWREAGLSTLPIAESDEHVPDAEISILISQLIGAKFLHTSIPIEKFVDPQEEEVIDRPPQKLNTRDDNIFSRGIGCGDLTTHAPIVTHKNANRCIEDLLLYLEQQGHSQKGDIESLMSLQNQVARKRIENL